MLYILKGGSGDRDGSTGPTPTGYRDFGRPAERRCGKGADRAAVAARDTVDAGAACHPAAAGGQNPPGPFTRLENWKRRNEKSHETIDHPLYV